MRRPYNEKEKALLDEMSRTEDPVAALRRCLAYEMETSAAARERLVAELLQLRRLLDAARREKRRLPPKVAAAVGVCDRTRLCRMAADIDRGDAAAEAALASRR